MSLPPSQRSYLAHALLRQLLHCPRTIPAMTPEPSADFEVFAGGTEANLKRLCVDCGLITGRFCDFCLAEVRLPNEHWCDGQMTPLCSRCDNRFGVAISAGACRGVQNRHTGVC